MTVVKVETITPAKAKTYLGENTHNRNIRTEVVDRLAGILERGEWHLTNDALTFHTDGRLLNGQHRLHAVVKAATPAEMLVLRGVNGGVQDVMDTGAKRSMADMLKLHGEKDPNMLAGALRQVWLYENGIALGVTGRGPGEASPAQILGVLARHPDIRSCLLSAHQLASYHVPGPPTVYAALRYLFGIVNEEDASTFFGKLALGEELSATNPLFGLRKTLLLAATRTQDRKPRKWYAAVMIKTWNAYQAGDDASLRGVYFRSGGANPEPFPKISGLAPEDLR